MVAGVLHGKCPIAMLGRPAPRQPAWTRCTDSKARRQARHNPGRCCLLPLGRQFGQVPGGRQAGFTATARVTIRSWDFQPLPSCDSRCNQAASPPCFGDSTSAETAASGCPGVASEAIPLQCPPGTSTTAPLLRGSRAGVVCSARSFTRGLKHPGEGHWCGGQDTLLWVRFCQARCANFPLWVQS
jgi:hypothetical protein